MIRIDSIGHNFSGERGGGSVHPVCNKILSYRFRECNSAKGKTKLITAVHKCSAVCLLHKKISNEQKGKKLQRSSGLAGGKSTTEIYTGSCTYSKLV